MGNQEYAILSLKLFEIMTFVRSNHSNVECIVMCFLCQCQNSADFCAFYFSRNWPFVFRPATTLLIPWWSHSLYLQPPVISTNKLLRYRIRHTHYCLISHVTTIARNREKVLDCGSYLYVPYSCNQICIVL